MKNEKPTETLSDAINKASFGDLSSIGKIGCIPITIIVLIVLLIYVISR
ncbi:MAG TPA: hypothetical protein VKZ77_11505 [Bacillaceae bacterium]|nr:hypothetical protein [Paenibacillus bovis]HLU23081.1 hypothetical protein [Bacillaceae bacterium]